MPVRGSNSLFFESGLDTSGLSQGANSAIGIVQGLAASIGAISPFGILIAGAAAASSAIGASAYDMMKKFESAMAEVKTIANVTGAEFEDLQKKVFALSAELGTEEPDALAKGLYDIIGAGYGASEALELLEISSKAATAGVTTSAVAADGLTTVLNAFQLEAKDATEVADIMFQTVNLGKISFEELSSQIAQVAPLAASSGYSFKEIGAAVATLTKQGVPASQAMTQIRSAIISVGEVMGSGASKTMTLQNAFQELYERADGDQDKLKVLTGRVEAMNAVLSIAGPNLKGATQDLLDMGNAAGSVDKSFETITSTTDNQWKILGNRISATTEKVGDLVLEISNGLASAMNDAIETGDKLEENLQKQQVELYKYETALLDVTEGTDEWKTIRDELMQRFPEMYEGIDKEAITTQSLLDVLHQVNEAYKERYKLKKREQELKEAQEKKGDVEIKIENTEQKFKDLLYNLRAEAEGEGVKIKLDFDKKPSEIIEDVEKKLRGANKDFLDPFSDNGFAAKPIQNLKGLIPYLDDLQGELIEASDDLTKKQERNNAIAKERLQTLAGQRVAIEEINAAMKASDLAKYSNSGIEKVQQAIDDRMKIINQFEKINAAKDTDALKQFLKSENEEIKNAAKERFRILNTDYSGTGSGAPGSEEDKKTFAETLEWKKKQYEKYYTAIEQYGKEAANKMFAATLEGGADFGEFLENQLNQVANVAEKIDIAVAASKAGIRLNRPEATSVNDLEAQGVMSPKPITEDFTLSIDYIRGEISKLNQDLSSTTSKAAKAKINEEIQYWENRLDVAQEGTEEEKELYNDVHRSLGSMSYEALKDYIDYWKDRLEEAEKGSDKEEEILGKIGSGKRALWGKRIEDTVGQLAEVSDRLRSIGQIDLANLIDGLQGAVRQVDNLFTVLDDASSVEDRIGAGIGAAIDLTDMLISSAAQRQQAEEDYYNSIISMQMDYNLLLNQELRNRKAINENVFTTDYVNEIQAGIDAFEDASNKYQESLKELSEGQAILGNRDAVDWGNVLNGAGAGAALGAAVGSVVPIVGNIVGGIVGAVGGGLAGLFGGQESEDVFGDLLKEYPELVKTAADGQKLLNTELAQTLIDQNLVNDATALVIENTIRWQEETEKAREQIQGVIQDLAGGLGNELRNTLVDAFDSGADAAVAMGETIEGVLKGIVEQLIFNKIFAEQFKNLEKDMENSFTDGGDQSWTDDFFRFYEEMAAGIPEWEKALADARNAGAEFGFDLTGPGTQDQRGNGLSGAIKGITEDQAGLLEGYWNAVRIDTRSLLNNSNEMVTIANLSLSHLSEIAVNTRYNHYLENMDRTMTSFDGRMATIESGILEYQARG